LRVQFRRLAVTDLESIKAWGLEVWGVDRTDGFLADMRQSIERLIRFPRLGRPHPALSPRLRSIRFGGYLIFYTVEPEGPTVARVLHERRDQTLIDLAAGSDDAS
jgi:toxin ParE1/3/4